jgi:Tfp pilus assembly protein PilW
MKALHDYRRSAGYTMAEMLVASAVCAVLTAGMFTTISALRKSTAASEHHAQSQVQQARLIDYMSRDLRRAVKVAVEATDSGERLNLTIPDYYDSTGGPREPIIEGTGVRYGTGEVAISYFKAGQSVYRSVNGAGTELASGLEKFEIDYTDDGEQAVTVGVSFIPRYQYDEATAEQARAGTATFATTLLRNKRQ